MAKTRRDPEPIGKILRSVLARVQPQQAVQREQLYECLAAVLPRTHRGRFKIDEIARGQVTVQVDTSSLLTEFRSFYVSRFLEVIRVQPGLESITKVRFKLGEFHGA